MQCRHMYRFIFLVQIVFCSSLLFFSVLHNSARAVPILDTAAKQTTDSLISSERKDRAVLCVLGRRGDISFIKARPLGSAPQYNRLPDIRKKITSRSAIIIDVETGQTLFAKYADTPRQPASTIKVLTGMIALKSLEEDDWVSVSRNAARMPRSKVYLDPEKTYKAGDLINAVLLASANDASVALAEKVAGSENQFAEMMTLRARLWGAENTVCRTATGLTAKGQQSTARDLANIFRHAMQDEDFASRMARAKIRTSYGKLLRNHNKALWTIDGAEGGKTGYTRAARQTYVGQFSGEEGSIIVAVMGSETMWTDVRNLVSFGLHRQKEVKRAGNKSPDEGSRVVLANK